MGSLKRLFAPNTVAIIGATDREGSVGRALLENLERDFDGSIVAVNPDRDRVLGHQCYASITDAPAVDLAVIVVPAEIVLTSLEECAEAGVDTVVVISAGFGEAGQEGAERERRLREIAEQHDMAVVGPNSLGVMSTPVGLNASFGPRMPGEGSIAFMSQSGAFITAVVDWAIDEGIGFRDVVSLGNKAVLDETDFVSAWGEDPETDVVIGYLESIEDGRSFIDAARSVTRETPIVLVKAGRTAAGAKAASSHTGAIAGSEAAYAAGLEAAGVIRARSVQELFDDARALSGFDVLDGSGVAVVTNAGGPGVLTTDAIGDADLTLADLADETVDELEATMPDAAALYNPVDIIGDADAGRFEQALDIVAADAAVDAIVAVSAPTAMLSYEELADIIPSVTDRHGTPIVPCLMGGERTEAAERRLGEHAIPNFFDPARAVAGIEALARYGSIRAREPVEPTTFDVDRKRAREIIGRARERDDPMLGVESMDLLEAYGIPTPEGEVVDDPAEAATVADSLGGPVVLKIVSPDISHKSDIGGVMVGVDPADVPEAFETVVTRARNYQPDARILGVQVQAQLDLDDATETIVGVNRDPQFGPLVLFGLGGIFVEILEDTSVRVAPVDAREAAAMVDEIKAAPLLRGARGREPTDTDAVVETIQRLSQLVTDFPAILELDINPLVAGPDGVQALDLRLTVDTDTL